MHRQSLENWKGQPAAVALTSLMTFFFAAIAKIISIPALVLFIFVLYAICLLSLYVYIVRGQKQ